ncbi:MAG: isocitrate/isopropylmalate dehydrogenase family protein, partial [Candidatus Aenigmarchaeota archaeon]|nr:isocitrate/isopropylmalate dehydrogenase family protein [Candidatus Aenigmarchaeota archaeon]
MDEVVEKAKEHFGGIVKMELERVERMKKAEDWVDYKTLKPMIIGIVGGDGIGPYITKEAQKILEYLLEEEA